MPLFMAPRGANCRYVHYFVLASRDGTVGIGKCKFNKNWLYYPKFAPWLNPVQSNLYEAHCTLCKKVFKLGTMGIKAVESHMESEKHKAVAKNHQQTPFTSIYQHCSVSSTSVPKSSGLSNGGKTNVNNKSIIYFVYDQNHLDSK